MPSTEELNAQLLERARIRHEEERAAFARDLKIVGLLVLAFQCFVFFPYPQVSDRLLALRPELERAAAETRAMNQVRAGFDQLQTTLASGTAELHRAVAEVPGRIRAALAELTEELQAFHAHPLGRASPRSPVEQTTLQRVTESPSVDGRFLRTLRPEALPKLHEARDKDPTAYQQQVVELVEVAIIGPTFRDLNEAVGQRVQQPLARDLNAVRGRTADLARLRSAGMPVDTWLDEAARVPAAAARLTLAPPSERDWWRSVEGKASYSDRARLDIDRIAKEAGGALQQQLGELRAMADAMQAALGALEAKEKSLIEASNQLEANAAKLQGLLDGYAKPLSVVALDIGQVVTLYPVALTALLVAFFVRHQALRRRTGELMRVHQQLGLAPEILALYFSTQPAAAATATPVAAAAFPSRPRLALAWLAVISLAGLSLGWVFLSRSLGPEAPRMLYAATLGTLAILAVLVLRGGPASRQVGPMPAT
jgi:hypothetical protein